MAISRESNYTVLLWQEVLNHLRIYWRGKSVIH